MKLILEKRAEHSQKMAILSPLIAIALTVLVGGIIFAVRGLNPFYALYIYFIDPVMSLWSIEQLVVKATPLILIGVGLAVCFTANVWNIGAEGQLTMGAVFGGMIPVLFPEFQSPLVMPLMLLLGVIGGMAYGSIPALLKNRFGANEILTSLMLVYVAGYILDWLVRGPWRDPMGFNFPKTVTFDGWQLLPTIGGTIHMGALLAVVAVVALAIVMGRTLKGFEIQVLGNAPRAGAFAGFSRKKIVLFSFLLSGGLAGLAGIGEVMSTVGQLQPTISPGYGFTAIIVAFLGRLNPIGVLFAGLMLGI
ncbi:MAG: ABC transporter permease, partial [Hyphomicrobiales bacterium]|nr:ABC transporter permease [Hyphomicrobiales bacterium]